MTILAIVPILCFYFKNHTLKCVNTLKSQLHNNVAHTLYDQELINEYPPILFFFAFLQEFTVHPCTSS